MKMLKKLGSELIMPASIVAWATWATVSIFASQTAKVNITGTTINTAGNIAPISAGVISCTNCNSMSFNTGNPLAAYYATYGTLFFQGSY